jgi:hypothetical protein
LMADRWSCWETFRAALAVTKPSTCGGGPG